MTWLLKALPLLKRYGPHIAAVVALLSVVGMIYKAGIDRCETAAQAALVAQANEHRAEVEREIQNALNLQAQEHAAELERVRSEQEVVIKTEEVIKYVDRIKEVPAECDGVARDVIRVLQQSTDAVREATRSAVAY